MSDTSGGVKVNLPILFGGLIVIGGIVALLAVGFLYDPRSLDTEVLTDKPAPTFRLETLDGEEVALADLQGHPVILNFWSTWCQPCKLEHPLLQRAPALYPEVRFVGVVYQDEPAKARAYLQRAPLQYDSLVDPDGRVAIAYGVTGVPETFFIDRSGRIRKKLARPLSERDLAETIGELLK